MRSHATVCVVKFGYATFTPVWTFVVTFEHTTKAYSAGVVTAFVETRLQSASESFEFSSPRTTRKLLGNFVSGSLLDISDSSRLYQCWCAWFGKGYPSPESTLKDRYNSSFFKMDDASDCAFAVFAFAETPLKETIVIAARMPITTITIRSSTIVKPLVELELSRRKVSYSL